ncbi:MAG: hypothetical protein ACJ0Q2_09265 [Candidatus Azotimanducaceae bacterium]
MEKKEGIGTSEIGDPLLQIEFEKATRLAPNRTEKEIKGFEKWAKT